MGLSLNVTASTGKQLFNENCAVCHGDKGQGGVGVPLALPSFQASIDNAYLHKTIREGRPGRIMPAFSTLSDAEIDAIIEEIRSWVPEQIVIKFSPKSITGNKQHGQQLFAKHCASCHGDKGQGGKGTGVTYSRPRDLPIIAPALNNIGFLNSITDQQIKYTLEHGRIGTPMVSFLDQGLSHQDIDDLVSFVRSLPTHGHDRVRDVEPTLVYDSDMSFDETVTALQETISGQNFRLIRTQYLDQGFVDEGQENKRQVMIYFCNFNFLFKAMAIDPRVGMFLPCRVSVVEIDGQVKVMTTNPLAISRIFNNNELDKLCDEMRETYDGILEEATL